MKASSKLIFCIILAAIISGCGDKAVPWDDDNRVLNNISMSMVKNLGVGHHEDPIIIKEAIEKAIDRNGYDYSATLKKVAMQNIKKTDIELIQLAALIAMPAVLAEKKEIKLESLYSGEDLVNIKTLISKLEALNTQ
jgi:hypothetical protein